MELTMSYIIKEKDGNIRDLTKNPHGAGYCNNCINLLNYGCLKNQNPQLCMVKESAVFEQCETRLSYPKMEKPQVSSELPKVPIEMPFRKLVVYLDVLARTDPKAYNVLVYSDQFQSYINDSLYRFKEMGLSNNVI
jgi:hypothetical protein